MKEKVSVRFVPEPTNPYDSRLYAKLALWSNLSLGWESQCPLPSVWNMPHSKRYRLEWLLLQRSFLTLTTYMYACIFWSGCGYTCSIYTCTWGVVGQLTPTPTWWCYGNRKSILREVLASHQIVKVFHFLLYSECIWDSTIQIHKSPSHTLLIFSRLITAVILCRLIKLLQTEQYSPYFMYFWLY